jgi:hypothetical protein
VGPSLLVAFLTLAVGDRPAADRVFFIPLEGPGHPVFGTGEPSDVVDAFLTLEDPVPSDDLEKTYEAWKKRTQAANRGKKLRFRKSDDGQVLHARVSGLADPRAALEDLVAAFSTEGLALAEVFLVRSAADRKGEPAKTRRDPRAPAEKDPPDAEAFWSALFDPEAPPPPSEDRENTVSMTFGAGGATWEERGIPLFLEGVRIAYGTPTVEQLERTPRCQEVFRAVVKALESRLPRGRPPILNRDGQLDTNVDRIGRPGRIGYAFALRRNEALTARYPDSFRLREYEVMAAMRDVIEELKLEPVVNWYRGSALIVNLWEKRR